MPDLFPWIAIYQEFAATLANWQERQTELIAFLEDLRREGYVVSSMQDKNREGARFLLQEIDPFTFFGVFNRGIRNEQRIAILGRIKRYFKLLSPIPEDFSGLPILNNQRSWLFAYQKDRNPEDVPNLWNVFRLALQENPLDKEEFAHSFDQATKIRGVNINLTMGLFWIRPYTFLSLDSTNRAYLKIEMPKGGLTSKFYLGLMKDISKRGQSIPELSLAAYNATHQPGDFTPPIKEPDTKTQDGVTYWLVGAYWDNSDPADQTQNFVDQGIWQN